MNYKCERNENEGVFFKGGGGGVQGQKSWKHDFEITDDPKGPRSGSTIWWGFEAPDSYGYIKDQ